MLHSHFVSWLYRIPWLSRKHHSCQPGVAGSCLWVHLNFVFSKGYFRTTPPKLRTGRRQPKGKETVDRELSLVLLGWYTHSLCPHLISVTCWCRNQIVIGNNPCWPESHRLASEKAWCNFSFSLPSLEGRHPPHTPPPSPWFKDLYFHVVGGGGGHDTCAWMDTFRCEPEKNWSSLQDASSLFPHWDCAYAQHWLFRDVGPMGAVKLQLVFQPICTLVVTEYCIRKIFNGRERKNTPSVI